MLKFQHVLPFLFLSACAVRQPAPRNWRFAAATLIPPGVSAPDLAQRTFTAPIRAASNCAAWNSQPGDAVTVRRRSAITLTVHREALLGQPRGWLTDWVDRVESEGCIPAGQGALLAAGILESVPLPIGAALRLLRDDGKQNFVELLPGARVQVITPIRRPGAAPAATDEPVQVSGEGYHLQVDMKAPADLIGFETAWYDLVPKLNSRGATFVPASVQVNVEGKVEDRPAPAVNLLQFAPEIGYYRLFYKADQTAVLALASTRAALPLDPDACASCFPIPRGIGINPAMRIEVNGVATSVAYYATVRSVIQGAKKRAEDVLPTLAITKPFHGRAVDVAFDRTKQEILNLALTGDETIRW
jgi:hypothetical protein